MTIIEEIPVESIDIEGSPPCSIGFWQSTRTCGMPSVCRMETTCNLAHREIPFLCAGCRDDILRGKIMCGPCLHSGNFLCAIFVRYL